MPQDQKYLSHNIILQFFAMVVCLVGMLTDEWYTYEETIELMTVNNAGIDFNQESPPAENTFAKSPLPAHNKCTMKNAP